MLGRITGVGDDGGLPCNSQTPAIRNPWKLGQTRAWLCLKPPNPPPPDHGPVLVLMQVLLEEEDDTLGFPDEG